MTVEKRLAQAYYSLLTRIDWADELLVNGMREGLNKFLSNAFGSMYPRMSKYHRTHFVSRSALLQLEQGNHVNLVYEHLVPKSQYIQKPCEDHARQETLTVDLIHEILMRYWKTATITKMEDDTLNRRNMPNDWDGVDPFARYRAASIELSLNPYFPPNHAESPSRVGTIDSNA